MKIIYMQQSEEIKNLCTYYRNTWQWICKLEKLKDKYKNELDDKEINARIEKEIYEQQDILKEIRYKLNLFNRPL